MTIAQYSNSIACPKCKAEPHKPCRAIRGCYRPIQPHEERLSQMRAIVRQFEAMPIVSFK